ncbi:MAG: hypothetical protein ACQESR_26480 [Planctomycetota bacterium]
MFLLDRRHALIVDLGLLVAPDKTIPSLPKHLGLRDGRMVWLWASRLPSPRSARKFVVATQGTEGISNTEMLFAVVSVNVSSQHRNYDVKHGEVIL